MTTTLEAKLIAVLLALTTLSLLVTLPGYPLVVVIIAGVLAVASGLAAVGLWIGDAWGYWLAIGIHVVAFIGVLIQGGVIQMLLPLLTGGYLIARRADFREHIFRDLAIG